MAKGGVTSQPLSVTISKDSSHFTLEVGGKHLLTKNNNALSVPTLALAREIQAEWRQNLKNPPKNLKKGDIPIGLMPLSQIAFIAHDMVTPHREKLVKDIQAFAETDLLLYWADAPPELVQAQKLHWKPIIDWFSDTYHVPLVTVVGSMPVKQPEVLAAKVADSLLKMDIHQFAAFHRMVGVLGSYFLALACYEARLSPRQAWICAILDESVQANKWGWDELAKKRLDEREGDFMAGADYLRLLGLSRSSA